MVQDRDGTAAGVSRLWPAMVGLLGMLASGAAGASQWELSGFVASELRVFPQSPAFPEQDDATLSPSVFAEPRLSVYPERWVERLTFVPFGRFDAHDSNRTHVDVREANALMVGDGWDLVVGIDRRFWGVTESRHLVNIINQVDQVEDVRAESFLGQPMINLNLNRMFGTFSFFVLPGFRERTFPDDDARLRGPLPIDDDAEFDSGAGRKRVDLAARYSHVVGPFDIGLAHFYGTSREPRLVPTLRPDGQLVLVPFYDVINQTSLDLQFTQGGWQLKLEALTRGGQDDRFFAAVGGFEYTWFSVFGTNADLGALAEYIYDGRDQQATATPFEDAVFAGLRLNLNDPASTAVLAGAVVDRSDRSTAFRLEGQRRLGDRWRLSLDAHVFANVDSDNLLHGVRRDSFVQLRLAHFF